MNNNEEILTRIISSFATRYIALLESKIKGPPRTFGFEYEFLPDRVLEPEFLLRIGDFLEKKGGKKYQDGIMYKFGEGIKVAFEPGGQIEYCSSPFLPDDKEAVINMLNFIEQTNREIFNRFDVRYVALGYIPGRAGAPLFLQTERYINLHDRLAKSGGRGHEMMKGTAAIHLHASICDVDEIPGLFEKFCILAKTPGFAMSEEREKIWSDTDPTRCGMPVCCGADRLSTDTIIKAYVRFGLMAVKLGTDEPFYRSIITGMEECSPGTKDSNSGNGGTAKCVTPGTCGYDSFFDDFLRHLTTVFTHVRFNLKGPTFELRTTDSIPVESFISLWERFIGFIEE